jgi:hypothetical protein
VGGRSSGSVGAPGRGRGMAAAAERHAGWRRTEDTCCVESSLHFLGFPGFCCKLQRRTDDT